MFVPELALAQKTLDTAVKMGLNASGEIPNWISSLGMAFLDSLSPLAYSMSEFLAGLMKIFIYVFLAFYLVAFGIKVMSEGKDIKFIRSSLSKRLFIIVLSVTALNIPPKYIFEYTVNPVLQIASQYTTGFMVNADQNYDKCVQTYMAQESAQANEVLTQETKANIVCPANMGAKQIDVLTRIGSWFVGTAVAEYIASIAAQFIPYAGKFVSIVFEYISYIIFAVGMYLLTQGFKLGVDILWTLLRAILQIMLPIMLLPLSIFSYAFEGEETGRLNFASGWRNNFWNMFKNGVVSFLFWGIAVGILGIFLQYIFNGLVIEIPNNPGLTVAGLMDSSSVFYTESGEIDDSVILGLIASFHNPANISTWIKFLFSLKLGLIVFEQFKSSTSSIAGNFVDDIKSYTETGISKVKNATKEYQKSIMEFIKKQK
ncbi:MAG: hypothetical protein LBR35_01965 [Rickettsiales bacterium]|nr:hypothetical protein [Rickettsiales bacterium]